MSDVWNARKGLSRLSFRSGGEADLFVCIRERDGGPCFAIKRDQARALASALLQWAGSDDPEWGPLIPWHGGECPLDEWERRNHWAIVKPCGDVVEEWRDTHLDQWAAGSGFPVIAYRVRKRPPAPVEEWVRRTVVLGEQSAKVEILLRDGKAVDARMAQEGE